MTETTTSKSIFHAPVEDQLAYVLRQAADDRHGARVEWMPGEGSRKAQRDRLVVAERGVLYLTAAGRKALAELDDPKPTPAPATTPTQLALI